MEVIKPFRTIYNMFDRMRNNDQQYPHTLQRLKALEKLVVFIKDKEPDQISDDVKEALEKLNKILSSAVALITKFSEAHMLNHMVKSSDYKLEFDSLNKSLTDAFVALSGALHVDQEKKLAEQQNKTSLLQTRLAEHEMKLAQQEMKLTVQEIKLAMQEMKLAEQEDILQTLESHFANESKAFYCTLQ